jgi:hypothetical protein
MGLGFVSNSGAADFLDDAAGLVNELIAALSLDTIPSPFLAPLSSRYSLDAIRVQDLNPGVSASFVNGIGQPGGNDVDDALPPSLALCVTWRTGLKGKQNRGRTYLTGFAEDSGNAGYWIPEIQTWAAGAFASPLMEAFGPLGTGNYALSVVHSMSGGVRINPPTASPIITYTVQNVARTLRRRGVGVRISRRPSAP